MSKAGIRRAWNRSSAASAIAADPRGSWRGRPAKPRYRSRGRGSSYRRNGEHTVVEGQRRCPSERSFSAPNDEASDLRASTVNAGTIYCQVSPRSRRPDRRGGPSYRSSVGGRASWRVSRTTVNTWDAGGRNSSGVTACRNDDSLTGARWGWQPAAAVVGKRTATTVRARHTEWRPRKPFRPPKDYVVRKERHDERITANLSRPVNKGVDDFGDDHAGEKKVIGPRRHDRRSRRCYAIGRKLNITFIAARAHTRVERQELLARRSA